jgi:acetyl esterase/lipase
MFSPETGAGLPRVNGEAGKAAMGGPLPGIRFYGRRRAAGPVPLVVHFHGGAFNSGSLESGSVVASLLAAAGAVVMSVDYPLAPGHPFPAAADSGYAALAWAHQHRAALAGKGSALFVAGEEAGGNIAAVVALMARDRHGPAVAGQILLSPMLDASMGTPSMQAAQPSAAGDRWADGWKCYLPCACDASHPYAAPSAGTRLAGLAPMLLVNAKNDPLRDEGRIYARRLRDAGVAVTEAALLEADWPAVFAAGVAGGEDLAAQLRSPWAEAVRAQLFTFLLTQPAAATRARGVGAHTV